MSDEGTATDKSSVSAKDIQALLDDVRAKTKLFDEAVASSNRAIVEAKTSVTEAKGAALAEIDQAKAAILTAKGTADVSLAEVGASRGAVDAAKVAALAEIEQSKVAVTTAKGVAEAGLAEIDKAKTAVATAKGAIEATQKTANADLASITQSKVTADKLQAAATAQAESLDAENKAVSDKIEELRKRAAPLEEILTTLTTIKGEAEAERASVAADIRTINDAKTNFEKLNTQTQEQYDALVTRRVTLDAQITEIGTAHASVKEIYKSLFEGSTGKKSIRTEIDEMRAQISKILDESTEHRDMAVAAFEKFKAETNNEKQALAVKLRKEFDQLHNDLEAKILALLPSAGAAGLASTYYDAKSRYAPTSFAGKPGGAAATEVRRWWHFSLRNRFGYNPASVVATIFFYVMFIIPILAIVAIYYFVFHDFTGGTLANLDYKALILRVLIALPLATISAFGFASLRLYRRLYEEYNHKQRVMELYTSFRQEVADNGTEEQKKALLTIMLNAVADKSYLAGSTVENKEDPIVLGKLNDMFVLLSNLAKGK